MERRTNWLIDQIGSKEKVEEYYNKTSTQIREMPVSYTHLDVYKRQAVYNHYKRLLQKVDKDEQKDLLRLLTAGSVDDGRSTLIGLSLIHI